MPKMHRRPIPTEIEKRIRKNYGEIAWGATREEAQMMDAFFPEQHLMAPEDSRMFTSFICIRCGYRTGEYFSGWRPDGKRTTQTCPIERVEYPNLRQAYYDEFPWGRAEAKWRMVPLWYKDVKRFRAMNMWRGRFGLKKLEWIEKEF